MGKVHDEEVWFGELEGDLKYMKNNPLKGLCPECGRDYQIAKHTRSIFSLKVNGKSMGERRRVILCPPRVLKRAHQSEAGGKNA